MNNNNKNSHIGTKSKDGPKKKRRKLQNLSSLTSEYFFALFHSKKSKQKNAFQQI